MLHTPHKYVKAWRCVANVKGAPRRQTPRLGTRWGETANKFAFLTRFSYL